MNATAHASVSTSPLWLAASDGEALQQPERQDGVKPELSPKRRKTTREKDNTEYLGFLRRAIRAAGKRVKAEDPSTLADLVKLQAELDAVIADAAKSLHDEHQFSWGDIAYELGVSRQAAFQRWGQRRDR